MSSSHWPSILSSGTRQRGNFLVTRPQYRRISSRPDAQRWQSTNPSSLSSSKEPPAAATTTSDPLPPPHRRSIGPPSKHKLFYRDIFPPLFRVLAYGSIVYFSLHLTWQYLDGREQKQLEDQVKEELEAQVRQKLQNRNVVVKEGDGRAERSWWGWLSGK